MLVEYVLVFFFFKQKTAYEMRISDWSSDVCSSDLPRASGHRGGPGAGRRPLPLLRLDRRPPSPLLGNPRGAQPGGGPLPVEPRAIRRPLTLASVDRKSVV